MLNTLKTSLGFVLRAIEKHTPLTLRSETIDDIYNYLPISEQLVTSGQPSEVQLDMIARSGFKAVINLAPNSVLENALVNEAEVLERLGVEYTHIPVNFVKPSERKYHEFVRRMKALEQDDDHDKVWVHCAANMRVSAFIYRYRTQEQGLSDAEARPDLEKIWSPVGVWQRFIKGEKT